MPNFRPPIVAVMGHIDHGKTSLLDKIRSTSVTKRESGGITQHTSAYQTTITLKDKSQHLITFLDTPGHAAFINMRSRGAQVTDLVVLVVSAVDGIMAQTKESVKIIKEANLPFIVAMNKMDLDGASPDKIKGQLVELGFTPEDYGGQVPCIPISAKTGSGLDQLLESIVLHSEVMELKSEPDAPLEAFVIESKLDSARGSVATAIIRKGTLKIGDIVYTDLTPCKVKALIDYNGKNVSEALPSTPIEILGFRSTPTVGSLVSVTPVVSETAANLSIAKMAKISLDTGTPRLPVVIKADVQGTLEALLGSFSDDVQVIASGVGVVTDNDVFLAQSSKAQIFAFNVNVPKFIKNLADNQKVKIFESKIIYEIIEMIQDQVLHLLEPTIDETVVGEATIIAEFKIEKVRIAGIKVTKGEISKVDLIHLKREDKIIKDTRVEGMHQAKNIVEKIKVGAEAGITFKPYVDFKINDVIIAYKTW